ncbi:protein of unknown function [Vibrio tapetis subsp. tapetis]|uniref:Uncharacterized protein n=1 Tax=Vibrio tapetis subsp. tapetis TaxID=1671868 RepID=A0A2N8ZM59_9VIBR|nr:protein of unknown function [Vibrio tapetis subsp. tapetis]
MKTMTYTLVTMTSLSNDNSRTFVQYPTDDLLLSRVEKT